MEGIEGHDQSDLLGQIWNRLAGTEDHLLRLEEALAQMDAKLAVRLDDMEGVMSEPLPVDVSGILHALDSKLFLPLDEMADSLAASQRVGASKTFADAAARLEQLVGAHQVQVLARLDDLADQIEALRRRVTLRSRPGARSPDSETEDPPSGEPKRKIRLR